MLGSLAISDALICSSKLPECIYFYLFGNVNHSFPYNWCIANRLLYIVHQIARASSNWLTVVLGLQRCFCVCMPLKCKRICTLKKTVITVFVVVFVATVLNIFEVIAITRMRNSTDYVSNLTAISPLNCLHRLSSIMSNKDESRKMYYMLCSVISRFLSIMVLCVASSLLSFTLSRKSNSLTSQSATSSWFRDAQHRRISRIVVAVTVIFLIAETQEGIECILYIVDLRSYWRRPIVTKNLGVLWDAISSMLLLLSYACNLWIFILMSTEFRSALTVVFLSPFIRCGIKDHRLQDTVRSHDQQLQTTDFKSIFEWKGDISTGVWRCGCLVQ